MAPQKKYHISLSVEDLAQGSLDFTLIANKNLKEKLQKKDNIFEKFCQETNLNGWYHISKKDITTKERIHKIVSSLKTS